MTEQINADSTNVTVYVFIQDTSSTDGDGLTGLVFNSSGLTCYYVRSLAAAVQLTLATQTVTGAHDDGGFVEVDSTDTPGLYRLDLSDAIVASGARSVVIMLKGATNMAPVSLKIQLDLVDNIWDEILTGATHNVVSSAGRRLRQTAGFAVREETAQGAGTGNNQIQLDSGASAVDGSYDPSTVVIIEGTGTGQSRLILQYDGATKTATVDRNWKVNPDATSVFQIIADAGREHVNEGLARGGTDTTITLNTLASSDDDAYVGQNVFIRSGTGEDQVRTVVSYNGTTKVATIDHAWTTNPDTTSAYVMLPQPSHFGYDALPELTAASDIPATPTPAQALMLLYMRERNDTQVTETERRILNDAGVEILDSTMSDDGTTFQQGKLGDA